MISKAKARAAIYAALGGLAIAIVSLPATDLNYWVAVIVTATLALELWSGVVSVPVPVRRTPRPHPMTLIHFAYRDEHQFAYRLAIGAHSAATAFLWWLALN